MHRLGGFGSKTTVPQIARIGALVLGLVTAILIVWFSSLELRAEGIQTGCTSNQDGRPPPSRLVTTDLTLFPPGYDCVYLNPENPTETVARTRAR